MWRQSVELAVNVGKFADRLVAGRHFSIADQISRAVVSIGANIAEGSARGSAKDYQRFVRIALGSVAELDTLLEIAIGRELLKPETHAKFCDELGQIQRQLSALWSSLGRGAKSQ